MKVPYTWLQEFVDVNQPIEQLGDSLSIAGFEVESIYDYSTRAKGVVVGYVETKEKHPQADKLSICKVNIGKEQSCQIVCGASNVRSNSYVLVAPPGAVLSAIDLKIKTTRLRGVESAGMICSLGELGFEVEDNGIAILDDMDLEIPEIGTNILKLFKLNEKVLDLAITANRPDGMSMVGIAREVSALTEDKLTIPITTSCQKTNIIETIDLDKDAIGDSGLYTLTIIENVNGSIKSPELIKDRLSKCGIKTINAIVDFTNYVLLEQGQPLHAFDLDCLEKISNKRVDQTSIGVRKARAEEKLLALDNNHYKLDSSVTVVTCHDIPIAIAGVIGGLDSSVSETTTKVLIECALFTPKSVRSSSKKIGIRTESSGRYEKGISIQNTLPSINRYIDILQTTFDPKLHETFIDKSIENIDKPILLRASRIHRILGPVSNKPTNVDSIINKKNYISNTEIETKLKLLGCNFTKIDNNWSVIVPAYRSIDLVREIDLIEEVARLIGFDRFLTNLPSPIKPGVINASLQAERRIRDHFSGSGFQELSTLSLVPFSSEAERIPISNPLLADTSHLRSNLWEEHLEICTKNISSGQNGCWIYEIGRIYKKINSQITEKLILGGAITGERKFSQWNTSGKPRKLDYFQARGLLHQALSPIKIGISDAPLTTNKHLHPGRASSLFLEGKSIGFFGQIHPNKVDDCNLDSETYIFELDLEMIIKASTRKNNLYTKYKEYPTVPFMERDIAIIVDQEITSHQITSVIKKTGKPLLENVELIDRYEGKNLPKGKISQAFRIRYRDSKNTLNDADINPIHEKIREELIKQVGGELRS